MTPSDMTALADQLVRYADIVPLGVRATMIEAAAALRAPHRPGTTGGMREALKQIEAVCGDNSPASCDKAMALDFVRRVAALAAKALATAPQAQPWANRPACSFPEMGAAAPQAQEDELYRIRDLIASHIACEKDCQEMPSGCGCALAAARAVMSRPHQHTPTET